MSYSVVHNSVHPPDSTKNHDKLMHFYHFLDVNYSFELIYIETYVPQFIEHNKFFLGTVK